MQIPARPVSGTQSSIRIPRLGLTLKQFKKQTFVTLCMPRSFKWRFCDRIYRRGGAIQCKFIRNAGVEHVCTALCTNSSWSNGRSNPNRRDVSLRNDRSVTLSSLPLYLAFWRFGWREMMESADKIALVESRYWRNVIPSCCSESLSDEIGPNRGPNFLQFLPLVFLRLLTVFHQRVYWINRGFVANPDRFELKSKKKNFCLVSMFLRFMAMNWNRSIEYQRNHEIWNTKTEYWINIVERKLVSTWVASGYCRI